MQLGHAGPSHVGDPPQIYKGLLEVMRVSDGKLAGTTASDEKGNFTIALAPGEYFITQNNPRPQIHSKPIAVEKGKFTSVIIYADNGMR